ncbi:Hypothetical protein R9X50_00087000 [Acrodontium crateriforme]|uniref:EthD domain-containing protein n=1 Tax=Acrodontium crateriforme TaxID=150365 RepID=A0AAQ3LZM8_9PEZI|nr:Hypothetical protein R9X50_00087000 [Acrodontium crateriforme]
MAATVTVLYPAGAKFNMDYYLSTHMPLVKEKWGPDGLTSYKVLKFNDNAPYSVQATLEFESLEAFQKAAGGPHTAEILGDVPNFSDKEPVLMPASIVGSS